MPAKEGSFQWFPGVPKSEELPLSAPCEWKKDSDGRCFTQRYTLLPVRHHAIDLKIEDIASPEHFQSLDLCNGGLSPLNCVFVSPVNIHTGVQDGGHHLFVSVFD